MERNQAETRISELRSQLEYHSDCYYNLDSPQISDFEYDTLMRELRHFFVFPFFARVEISVLMSVYMKSVIGADRSLFQQETVKIFINANRDKNPK